MFASYHIAAIQTVMVLLKVFPFFSDDFRNCDRLILLKISLKIMFTNKKTIMVMVLKISEFSNGKIIVKWQSFLEASQLKRIGYRILAF